VPWRRRPDLYRQHALFVTASADQAREQLASGARVIMIGDEPVPGTVTPPAGGWDLPALRETAGTLRERPPLDLNGIWPALREIFTGSATPARLGALGRLTGLGDHVISGRRIAVLARADDAGAAAALAAALGRQRLLPAEVVVVTEAPDEPSAEISARAVTAALGDLADQGVSVRALPAVAGEPAGWRRRAASAARSPWAAPWPAGDEHRESYLLDLACARECAQADATGYAGAGYAFTTALDPALARREFFTSDDPGDGLRLFSVSEPAKEHQR
jgi:hypothetical protein